MDRGRNKKEYHIYGFYVKYKGSDEKFFIHK